MYNGGSAELGGPRNIFMILKRKRIDPHGLNGTLVPGEPIGMNNMVGFETA